MQPPCPLTVLPARGPPTPKTTHVPSHAVPGRDGAGDPVRCFPPAPQGPWDVALPGHGPAPREEAAPCSSTSPKSGSLANGTGPEGEVGPPRARHAISPTRPHSSQGGVGEGCSARGGAGRAQERGAGLPLQAPRSPRPAPRACDPLQEGRGAPRSLARLHPGAPPEAPAPASGPSATGPPRRKPHAEGAPSARPRATQAPQEPGLAEPRAGGRPGQGAAAPQGGPRSGFPGQVLVVSATLGRGAQPGPRLPPNVCILALAMMIAGIPTVPVPGVCEEDMVCAARCFVAGGLLPKGAVPAVELLQAALAQQPADLRGQE
uniref:Uncharacterized protein n=1 Tax=Varanus komodoensis TaxID=61221 RepID=A0A8D2KYT6_VARKO